MSSNLTETGILGLDALLGGGIPTGRIVLILGEPGAGKTTLCAQFIANGYSKNNEHGAYVSLEENKIHFFKEMSRFKLNFAQAENDKQFAFVDASPIRHVPSTVKVGNINIGKKDFSLVSLLDATKRAVSTIDAKRLVIDPLSYLIFQYPDLAERRAALLDLMEGLAETKATVLLASELESTGSLARRNLQLEEYIAHGTVIMQSVETGKTLMRTIQIQKMRECDIDRQPRPYRIGQDGIEVFHRESIFQ